MSAASRQGSSSFVIVIAGAAFVLVGAMVLTFVMFPTINNMTTTTLFSAETAPGQNLTSVVDGLWRLWSLVLLLMLTVFVWVKTRQ